MTGGQVWAAGGVAIAEVQSDGEMGIAGFDPFTGLQLWHIPGVLTAHNYTTTLDHERMVIRDRPTRADRTRNDKHEVVLDLSHGRGDIDQPWPPCDAVACSTTASQETLYRANRLQYL